MLPFAENPPPELRVLQEVFGFERFRGQQAEIIAHAVSGGDAVVVMPTGSGKSLCFQLPALLRPGVTVVVSPLIALMKDQVDSLLQLGVRAAFLNSTLSDAEASAVEGRCERGELDLLYVAPERLVMESFLALLERSEVGLFAIDEAHCASQWGHDFRADYLRLGVLGERFGQVPRMALTATADARTREDIAAQLSMPEARWFVGGYDRPNIRYSVRPKSNGREQLLRMLRDGHQNHAGIVYCLSRKRVEATASWLCEQGFNALPYHAGLDKGRREDHQARFARADDMIMVATVAFGMGIDKPDIRFVAHLDPPKSIEAYYQETGRAGRDGEPADAWMVYGLQDVVLARQLVDSGQAPDERKRIDRGKLNALLGYCETTRCRRQVLLKYFGDEMPERCGNCDTCLEPVASYDGTIHAQMALSAVYRTGQRFGAGHLIDVLVGHVTERIERLRHDQLKTFSVGKEMTRKAWHSVYRQLVSLGLLSVDTEGYGTFRLTEASRAVLRGEQTVDLRRDPLATATRATPKPRVEVVLSSADGGLFEALRQKRIELARAQNVPPYVIFHDRTLMEMAARKPANHAELGELHGVGKAKLERYGDSFLQVIAAGREV